MVDFFLVLMLAGAGDELQGIKKGILEIADALAVNKADGDNMGPATRAVAEYRGALRLLRQADASWNPPVLPISSLESRGMDEVWELIGNHRTVLEASGELAERRRQQQQSWFWNMVEDGLRAKFLDRRDVKRLLPEMETAVGEATLTPTEAARRLLALLGGDTKE